LSYFTAGINIYFYHTDKHIIQDEEKLLFNIVTVLSVSQAGFDNAGVGFIHQTHVVWGILLMNAE
jgi:hypothetical protein